MGKRISIRADLSVEDLERRYRQAHDPVARSQWYIVWLLARGQRSEQIAALTGYSRAWVCTIARRYNTTGETGIGDQRVGNGGRPRRLTAEQEAQLDGALDAVPRDGGRWTARKVAAWIEERTGEQVGLATGWRYLRRLDRRRYAPRPQHAKADEAAQAAFKKTRSASR